MIVVCAPKNVTFKIILQIILCNENTLWNIISPNMAFKTRKHFQTAGYKIQNLIALPHLLTTVVRLEAEGSIL